MLLLFLRPKQRAKPPLIDMDLLYWSRHFRNMPGEGDLPVTEFTRAIADYERTRMSGNSPWDRWRYNRDESAVSAKVKEGHELFNGNLMVAPDDSIAEY